MMEKRGNEIYITSKAKQLLELVPEELKKPELTADWEMKLSDIANGKLRQDKFLTGIREYACEIVDEIKSGQGTFRHDKQEMPQLRKTSSGSKRQECKDAGVRRPGMWIQGDGIQNHQCTLPEMPQAYGDASEGKRRNLCMPVRI